MSAGTDSYLFNSMPSLAPRPVFQSFTRDANVLRNFSTFGPTTKAQ